MSGIIAGAYGYQRSGKTLIAYMIADKYHRMGFEVYSNMNVEGWNKINSLTDIPFNYEPKVLLLDEVYYFMDSRNWKNNTDSSIFFNTIGKQNILLLLTAISPDMVELRLREQHNYMFLVKSDKHYIYYKLLDVVRKKEREFILPKSEGLFKKLRYDTNQIPDMVDCSVKDFAKKVKNYSNTIEGRLG
jgi:hypothetical protein